MLPQYLSAERVDFAMKAEPEPSPLQTKVEATDPREKRGYGVGQDGLPLWLKT